MKGIAFSPAMLRAFRDGRKTVTRRLVKRPADFSDAVWNSGVPHNQGDGGHGVFGSDPYLRVDGDDETGRVGERIRCPHGIAGDTLWIREALVRGADDFVHYSSDDSLVPSPVITVARGFAGELRPRGPVPWKWTPRRLAAMYCPRWASRDTIELAEVRVERLHQITEQDAIAEGIEPIGFPRDTFAALWDALNKKRAPWSANPWIWRLAFSRCT